MWSSHISDAGVGNALRFTIKRRAMPATYMDVLTAWSTNAEFCAWFNNALAAAPFAALRWETPPVTSSTRQRAFEFVLLDSPELAREASVAAFSKHFASAASDDVIVFPNLGGDAVLVVPRPIAANSAYGHIGAFVRAAPETQRLALWQAVGNAMSRRLSAQPVWLSTAGAGVPWLHVRLDDRPKYYGFAPFRVAP